MAEEQAVPTHAEGRRIPIFSDHSEGSEDRHPTTASEYPAWQDTRSKCANPFTGEHASPGTATPLAQREPGLSAAPPRAALRQPSRSRMIALRARSAARTTPVCRWG